jgi:hypothetical protein
MIVRQNHSKSFFEDEGETQSMFESDPSAIIDIPEL